jgi:hypothetical protein
MPAPANDDLANAQLLTGKSGSINGTTVDATVDAPYDPINDNLGGGSTVWYKLALPGAWDILLLDFVDEQPGQLLQCEVYSASAYPPTSNADITGVYVTQVGSGFNDILSDFVEGLTPDGFLYLGVGTSFPGADEKTFSFSWAFILAATQVFGGTRFYEAPPWRIIVGDLEDNTVTFLDRLALDRSVTVTRAAARVISGRVPSDNGEVNIPLPDPDGEPFLSEGTRIVSCFRREAPLNAYPWVIRARGLVLGLTDDADTDHATSTFTAYDPWKYWYRRPVLRSDGTLGDVSYPAGTRANEILIDQFQIASDNGGTIFTDFGQTAFYTGTIEDTEPLPDGGDGLAMTFRSGTTLGEMCDLLVATGTCDIVNDPIYDINNRPGLLTETSVYVVAGSFKPNAIFGWDRWPQNLVQLSRQLEGTERANMVQMYAGQGGPPVPLEQDAMSLARFGEYWALQYLPGVPSLAGAHMIAQRQLALLKDGQYTYALSPAAERAPLLFEDYREADTMPVYASPRFRDPIVGLPVRVEAIPIVIGDDQLERVNQMLVSFVPEPGS